MNRRVADLAEPVKDPSDLVASLVFLRLSLAMALFASIADRFQVLDPLRGERIGDFVILLLWWSSHQPGHPLTVPTSMIASIWAFSIVEAMVGAALFLGLLTRLSSLAAGLLLLCTTAAVMVEPKTSFAYSVPAAAAASFLLALLPASAGSWSLDTVLRLQEAGSGRWAGRLVRIGALTGLVFLAVLVLGMIGDIMSAIPTRPPQW
jgi:uncharacterized membrane protein YphA (DoxX/SURF4 family)